MNTEAKPCPICGKQPVMELSKDDSVFPAIYLFYVECCGEIGAPSDSVIGAIENWNRIAEGEKS